ncbi:MAG TPA: hypothetical protein VK590_13485, partial [Saprospiraceae bacterium]|nr:hypothetical protein [Saprospiraceae bacterium]
KDGGLFLKPVAWHDKSQEYFWTDSFQEKMKEAQKDIEKGDFKAFNSLSDVADYLEKSMDDE